MWDFTCRAEPRIEYSALKSPHEKQSVNIQQTNTSKRQSIPHQDK